MLARTAVIAFNTYREAVRARVLHGLFALALATALYSTVISEFASRAAMRVVSDFGAASISVYGIVVAVVLAATSLYRELELKTIFPILARPISRTEYLVGKYLGTWLTIVVFCVANCAVLLLELAIMAGTSFLMVSGATIGSVALAVLVAWRAPRWRTIVPLPWAFLLLAIAFGLASSAPDERRVVLGAAALTVIEVGIVTAIAMFFAAFSSPFLTAIFTLGVFVVGRSADTLARLPERVFGSAIHYAGEFLSRVVPNLMLYVPPRTLLTGEAAHTSFTEYLPLALAHGVGWSVGLLAVASLIFRRRDFL